MPTNIQEPAPCPLCGESALVSNNPDNDRDSVECDRCGRYRISGTAREVIEGKQYKNFERARLSAAARRSSNGGNRLDITTDALPQIIDSVSQPRDPMEAGDEVVMYAYNHTVSFGSPVPFNIATAYPLFVLLNPGALSAVVQYLESQNWITATRGPTGTVTLQPPGYARVRELRATTKASNRGFIAMSFNPKLRPAYDTGIRPAIVSFGFKPIRMDDEAHNDRIDERIMIELRRSAFVVADVSDPRTGVYFEAGYALGLGIPVIWTCSAAAFGDLATHFDTRQFNHIKWDTPDDLRLQLKTRILLTVPGAIEVV